MNAPRYFRLDVEGDILVVVAERTIVNLAEDEIRTECDSLLVELQNREARHAVIDLAALDYFGSIMLELMVVVWRQVTAAGGTFVVCNVSDVGREILQTAKFDSIWQITTSREEALAAVRK